MKIAPAGPQPCPAPPPGTLRRPRHPLLGIVFVHAVAAALVCGAVAADPVPRLAAAAAGLCVFLAAAVHWLEGVDMRHVPAKLGLSRPGRRWWLVGAAAALPAWIAAAWGISRRAGIESPPVALLAAIAGDALWQESFYRGFAFRGLMRRHGFVLAAAGSAFLAASFVFVGGRAGHPLYTARAVSAALVELLLSFALCQLFWLAGAKLPPALLVRVSLLGAAWLVPAAWPALAAAAVLLVATRAASTHQAPA